MRQTLRMSIWDPEYTQYMTLNIYSHGNLQIVDCCGYVNPHDEVEK